MNHWVSVLLFLLIVILVYIILYKCCGNKQNETEECPERQNIFLIPIRDLPSHQPTVLPSYEPTVPGRHGRGGGQIRRGGSRRGSLSVVMTSQNPNHKFVCCRSNTLLSASRSAPTRSSACSSP